ncbi:hypothetical protein LCGC14_2997130, partial [marine sediment metagenome]
NGPSRETANRLFSGGDGGQRRGDQHAAGGAGAGELCDVINTFVSGQASGVIEFLIRTTDATFETEILVRNQGGVPSIEFRINAENFQYNPSGVGYTILVTALDGTWYHIKFEFECGAGTFMGLAADTYNIWINNIKYGPFGFDAVATTLDDIQIRTNAGDSGYTSAFDAFSFSWTSGNEIADNRTLDYKAQSYDDITSNLSLAEVSDEAYLTSTAIIKISKDLVTLSGLHILQLYDVNSDLRFEGNYFKKTTNAGIDIFTFHSLNKSNLKKPNTYTASSLDPSQILLNIFTAIGQAASDDARLQYYEEDDPAGSHSPTIINTPNREIIRRMAYHADRYAIIQPNGVFTLDADKTPRNGAYTISIS